MGRDYFLDTVKMMHIHILGIGGTFMSGLALLARELGHHVTGSDTNCYPPVSELLAAQNIAWTEGYEDSTGVLRADCVLVGNAMKRGMPVIEAVLNAGQTYISGPQWLSEHVLQHRNVLAVAGTHGKTTTASMLAWILEQAGLQPGFLIGGVVDGFKKNAQLGQGAWFVIEADEYDSAFFDKRPKLMHYRPKIAILNNLEFDHADIYENLGAIQQQFHYFLKTIPGEGLVIKPRDDQALNEVLARGQFSRLEDTAFTRDAVWCAELLDEAGQQFNVFHRKNRVATVDWSLIGRFNVENGLAAIAASSHVGVEPERSAAALRQFTPPKRRLEVKAVHHGITLYDDFAHHPTAVAKTIEAVKQSGRHRRILVVLEFASNSMRTGVHAQGMTAALSQSDRVYLLNPADFDLSTLARHWSFNHQIFSATQPMVEAVLEQVQTEDAILVMSNKGFDGIHQRLILGIQGKSLAKTDN